MLLVAIRSWAIVLIFQIQCGYGQLVHEVAQGDTNVLNVTIAAMFARIMVSEENEAFYNCFARAAVVDMNAPGSPIQGLKLEIKLIDISILRMINDAQIKEGTDFAQHYAESLAREASEARVVAATGAAYSSDAEVLAPALGGVDIPLISNSATAAMLSDTEVYPLFGRVCLPDSKQVLAIVDTVKRFGWNRIGIVQCPDVYCRGLADGVRRNLVGSGQSIDFTVHVPQTLDEDDVAGGIRLIQQGLSAGCDDGGGDTRAVVLALAHDLDLLVDAAMQQNVRTAWVGADAFADSLKPDLVISSGSSMMTIQPNYGGSRDADFQRIKKSCPGAEILAKEDAYVQMVYDAVWAIGLALDEVHARGGDVYDGASIIERLKNVHFTGLSGTIAFDQHLDLEGSYTLREVGNDGLRTVVGKWDEDLRQVILTDPALELRHDSHNPCSPTSVLVFLPLGIGIVVCCWGIWHCRKKTKMRKRSTNTVFLCYNHDGSASEQSAERLQEAFEKHVLFQCKGLKSCQKFSRGRIFLPSQDFYDAGGDAAIEVRKSKCFVLILDWTRSVFEQPRCLFEIHSALTAGIPIVPVELFERTSDGVSREMVQWPDQEQLFRTINGGSELRHTVSNSNVHNSSGSSGLSRTSSAGASDLGRTSSPRQFSVTESSHCAVTGFSVDADLRNRLSTDGYRFEIQGSKNIMFAQILDIVDRVEDILAAKKSPPAKQAGKLEELLKGSSSETENPLPGRTLQ